MIHTLLGIAIRILVRNKSIFSFSVISICLSAFLMITMSSFIANANRSMEMELKQLYGNVDILAGYRIEENKSLNTPFIKKIQAIDEVDQASPVLISNMFVNELSSRVYTAGIENDTLSKSRYHFNSDLSNQEIMLNKSLADTLQVRLSDRITIEARSYVIKEILEDIDSQGPAPDILLMTRDEVRQIEHSKTQTDNQATYLLVKVSDGQDVISLADKIQKIDANLSVDVVEEDPFYKKSLALLNQYIVVFSVMVVMVISLLVISNFEVLLYKYRFQFAVLRSMGAQTSQLFKMVFVQCTTTNIVGVLSGLLLSCLSYSYITPWLSGILSIPIAETNFDISTAALVAVVSFLTIEIFMLIPAYRSSRILPLKMLEINHNKDFKNLKRRKVLGKFLISGSIFFIVSGTVFAETSHWSAQSILFGLFLFVMSVFQLMPVYLPVILVRISTVLNHVFGNESLIAVKNMIPQVKRNTFVILIVSVLMIISVIGSSLLNTIQKNEKNFIKQQFATDIVIENRSKNSSIDLEQVKQEILKIENIGKVSTVSWFGLARLDNEDKTLSYVLADIDNLVAQQLLPTITNLNDDIIITERFAKDRNLRIGDQINLSIFPERDSSNLRDIGTMTVAAITSSDIIKGADLYGDWSNSKLRSDIINFDKAFITPIDEEHALKQLEELKKQFPTLQINSYSQALKNSKEMSLQIWSIFISVMIVVILSVLIGVFNSLINNIYHKRKEFAILRAISLDKRGLIQVILTQVILYLCIGMFIGITVGIILMFAFKLIDPTPVYIDYSFIFTIAGIIIFLAFIVFVTYGRRLANRKVATELNQSNV